MSDNEREKCRYVGSKWDGYSGPVKAPVEPPATCCVCRAPLTDGHHLTTDGGNACANIRLHAEIVRLKLELAAPDGDEWHLP